MDGTDGRNVLIFRQLHFEWHSLYAHQASMIEDPQKVNLIRLTSVKGLQYAPGASERRRIERLHFEISDFSAN